MKDTAARDAGASSAELLLHSAGLVVGGSTRWGTRVELDRPGVYVVATPEPSPVPSIDRKAVATWIKRVPTLRLDGSQPTADALVERLTSFWIPNEPVVYLGRAGSSVRKRVRQFYRTPLGDPRPHAGGHWLKTLAGLETLRVWWAETDDPVLAEEALFVAFASRYDDTMILPFANRQNAHGSRRSSGIQGSTLSSTPRLAAARQSARYQPPAPRSGEAGATGSRISQINAALQKMACTHSEGRVRAVEAARELERLGLLTDSQSRPGKPLRELLRAGRIDHAYQEGVFWFIPCAQT